VQKENELRKEKEELDKKRKEYDLAIKSIQTSVEDLAFKKAKLHEQPKQTDIFMGELRKNKNSKDHMIEVIYGRMFAMDKRVESLSKDN
jgi:chromosome segregation ATPase